MKRSDMIEVISEYLINLPAGSLGRSVGYRTAGKEILEAIEKAGMLPPAKHIDIASGRILHYLIYTSIIYDIIAGKTKVINHI